MRAPVETSMSPLDPYLRWFVASGADLFGNRRKHAGDATVGLVIVWKSVDDARRAARLLADLSIKVPQVYAGSPRVRRVWALSVGILRLPTLLETISAHAARIELASPVGRSDEQGLERKKGRLSRGKVLTAVLDDGCAFANRRFMSACGSRVAWLWDQDADKGGRSLDGSAGPSPLADFHYGREWAKADLDAQLALAPGDDESSAYEAIGATNLRRAVVHGTHVMDLFTGGGSDEIVFVQFPSAGIEDPSGGWLARNALDGLLYVLECAGPDVETIVVNLSWGPQTGPHDGSSALEIAIDELVVEQEALRRKLIVCLPSGNSYGARAHARLDPAQGGRLDWHVPPDGAAPQFLEIWWPPTSAPADIRMRITPPGGGARVVVDATTSPGVQPGWYAALQPSTGQGAMVFVVVNSTGGFQGPGADRGASGRWTLEFDPVGAAGQDPVHVYVARADHNMGARRRAKASYLSDPALAAARFVPAALRDAEAPGSLVRREGTINGLATGTHSRVASGYSFQGLGNARYSSAGPGRNGRRPDHACATDRSTLRQGIAASGVRSGTKVVLVGTSTAAPQLARQLAGGGLTVLNPPPATPPCRDHESRLQPAHGVIHTP